MDFDTSMSREVLRRMLESEPDYGYVNRYNEIRNSFSMQPIPWGNLELAPGINRIPEERLVILCNEWQTDTPAHRFGIPDSPQTHWVSSCYDVETFLAGMPDSGAIDEARRKHYAARLDLL